MSRDNKIYTDMGLSSGLMWKDVDEGSLDVFKRGRVYTWGAGIITKGSTFASLYDEGVVDIDGNLTLEYDKFYQRSGFRIPSVKDWLELLENVNIRKFSYTDDYWWCLDTTSKSESSKTWRGFPNSVLLPGLYGEKTVHWTSTFNKENSSEAWCVVTYEDPNNPDRCCAEFETRDVTEKYYVRCVSSLKEGEH